MNAPATEAALQNSAPAFLHAPLAAIKLSTGRVQILRRARFQAGEIEDLADDIRAHDVIQPILLRYIDPPEGDFEYELVAGERRYLGSKIAGKDTIPAIVRDITVELAEEMQIAENIQRKSYHPLEEAEGYQRLCQIHKCSAKDLVPRVNKNEAHIYARMKLLQLCPQVKDQFYAGKLIASIALEIARIPDDKLQQEAARGCITGENTGEFYKEYLGPLLFEDAREYIETEFMRRIDGNRAIAEARKKKLPAIDGDDAAKLWKAPSEPPAGYELLDGEYWDGATRKPFAAVLSANDPAVVLIQNPFTGEAKRCLPKEAVIATFKAKKVLLPNHLKQRELPLAKTPAQAPAKTQQQGAGEIENAQQRATDFAAKKEQERMERDKRKQQLAIEIQIATFKAVRARYPKKLGKSELLLLLQLLDENVGASDVSEAIVSRPKSINKCQERELVAYILDYYYGHEVESPAYNETALLAAAKRYNVNAAKIARDITAAAESNEAAIARALKASTVKPAKNVSGKAGKKGGKK